MPYNKEWGEFIPDGAVNKAIASWQAKQPDRVRDHATPSSMLECPRVVWLKRHGVPTTNELGWGKKQRFMLGRQLENMIASQLRDEAILLHHWKDDAVGDSDPFEHGSGLTRITGTPDLLLKIGNEVVISDSKTSRSDSFKYVPINPAEIWDDWLWFKYKMQLTAYYMLCHWNKTWFSTYDYPLPTACHLFSYALDDGIVRREIKWTPTQADFEQVLSYIKRWNEAYAAKEMPDCTCEADDPPRGRFEGGTAIKFCYYGVAEEGAKIASSCCAPELIKEVK